jgi:hypothetical protein
MIKRRTQPKRDVVALWLLAVLVWALGACSRGRADELGSISRALGNIDIGDTTVEVSTDNGNNGSLWAQQATLSQAAAVRSLSFYVDAAAGSLRLGVYSDNAGSPGTLQASTDSTVAVAGWNTLSVTTPVQLNPGTYWLAYEYDNAGLTLRSVPGGAASMGRAFSYAAMPASFGATDNRWTGHWSFYATLSTGADAGSGDGEPPSVPTDLAATVASSSQINLSWNASSDNVGVIGYAIYRCSGAGCSPTTQVATSPTAAFNDSGLSASTTYGYAVSAYDAAGNASASSSPAQFGTTQAGSAGQLTLGDTTVEAQVDDGNNGQLNAQPVTLGQSATLQSLSFFVGTAAGNLRLGIYSDSRGSPGTLQAQTDSAAAVSGWNTLNVTSSVQLNPGSYWLVYEYDNAGLSFRSVAGGSQVKWRGSTFAALPSSFGTPTGSWAGRFSFYATLTSGPADTQAPSVPAGLLAAVVSSSQINLSWAASTDDVAVSGYKIFRCSGAGCTPTAQVATSTTTSYGETSLSASTTYGHAVAAYDAAGNVSGLSSTQYGTTQAASGVAYVHGLNGAGTSYFVDQNGNPKLILGDECWGFFTNAGRYYSGNSWQSEMNEFLLARRSQGFNVLYLAPFGHTQYNGVSDDGRTWDGLTPWQNQTIGSLNEPFWQRWDYLINTAASYGITVFFNLGMNIHFSQGGALFNGSVQDYTNYGEAMGTRYKNAGNLIWMIEDDYFGGYENVLDAIVGGIRSTGDTHPISCENQMNSTSRKLEPAGGTLAWGAANAQYNFVYSYSPSYYGVEFAYREGSASTVLQGDGPMMGSDQAGRFWVWWALSSAARGVILISENIWIWNSGSLHAAEVTDSFYASGTAGNIRAAVESLPGWQNLLPDLSSQLVTSGRGTYSGYRPIQNSMDEVLSDNYVTASVTPDGRLALIFMSHASTIGIDEAVVGGVGNYLARRIDPASGTATAVTAGPSYDSAAWGTNSAGGSDWVLALQHQ